MKETAGAFFVLLAYMAILFLLVRPGSQGPTLVNNVSSGLSNLIKAATGGGTWSQA